MRRRLTALLLAASLIPSGAGAQARHPSGGVPAPPDLDSYRLLRLGRGEPVAVSADQAANRLKNYDVVFIGEFHDQIANQLAEMALLRALYARDPAIALSLEQFERDVQPAVDDYLAGRIGEESLKTKGRAWDNYAEGYRPLVEFAKDHGLAVIAANAPAGIVRCVAREGAGYLLTLSSDKRGWAAAELHTDDGPYKQKFLQFLGQDAAHGGPADAGPDAAKAAADRSFAAQVTRDDTMADSIATYLAAHPDHKLVHVTGEFHVADRLGTIERLKLRAPNLKIALVLPVAASGPQTSATMADKAKGADFAILLRPEPQAYISDQERAAAESREAMNIRAATGSGCTP